MRQSRLLLSHSNPLDVAAEQDLLGLVRGQELSFRILPKFSDGCSPTTKLLFQQCLGFLKREFPRNVPVVSAAVHSGRVNQQLVQGYGTSRTAVLQLGPDVIAVACFVSVHSCLLVPFQWTRGGYGSPSTDLSHLLLNCLSDAAASTAGHSHTLACVVPEAARFWESVGYQPAAKVKAAELPHPVMTAITAASTYCLGGSAKVWVAETKLNNTRQQPERRMNLVDKAITLLTPNHEREGRNRASRAIEEEEEGATTRQCTRPVRSKTALANGLGADLLEGGTKSEQPEDSAKTVTNERHDKRRVGGESGNLAASSVNRGSGRAGTVVLAPEVNGSSSSKLGAQGKRALESTCKLPEPAKLAKLSVSGRRRTGSAATSTPDRSEANGHSSRGESREAVVGATADSLGPAAGEDDTGKAGAGDGAAGGVGGGDAADVDASAGDGDATGGDAPAVDAGAGAGDAVAGDIADAGVGAGDAGPGAEDDTPVRNSKSQSKSPARSSAAADGKCDSNRRSDRGVLEAGGAKSGAGKSRRELSAAGGDKGGLHTPNSKGKSTADGEKGGTTSQSSESKLPAVAGGMGGLDRPARSGEKSRAVVRAKGKADSPGSFHEGPVLVRKRPHSNSDSMGVDEGGRVGASRGSGKEANNSSDKNLPLRGNSSAMGASTGKELVKGGRSVWGVGSPCVSAIPTSEDKEGHGGDQTLQGSISHLSPLRGAATVLRFPAGVADKGEGARGGELAGRKSSSNRRKSGSRSTPTRSDSRASTNEDCSLAEPPGKIPRNLASDRGVHSLENNPTLPPTYPSNNLPSAHGNNAKGGGPLNEVGTTEKRLQASGPTHKVLQSSGPPQKVLDEFATARGSPHRLRAASATGVDNLNVDPTSVGVKVASFSISSLFGVPARKPSAFSSPSSQKKLREQEHQARRQEIVRNLDMLPALLGPKLASHASPDQGGLHPTTKSTAPAAAATAAAPDAASAAPDATSAAAAPDATSAAAALAHAAEAPALAADAAAAHVAAPALANANANANAANANANVAAHANANARAGITIEHPSSSLKLSISNRELVGRTILLHASARPGSSSQARAPANAEGGSPPRLAGQQALITHYSVRKGIHSLTYLDSQRSERVRLSALKPSSWSVLLDGRHETLSRDAVPVATTPSMPPDTDTQLPVGPTERKLQASAPTDIVAQASALPIASTQQADQLHMRTGETPSSGIPPYSFAIPAAIHSSPRPSQPPPPLLPPSQPLTALTKRAVMATAFFGLPPSSLQVPQDDRPLSTSELLANEVAGWMVGIMSQLEQLTSEQEQQEVLQHLQSMCWCSPSGEVPRLSSMSNGSAEGLTPSLGPDRATTDAGLVTATLTQNMVCRLGSHWKVPMLEPKTVTEPMPGKPAMAGVVSMALPVKPAELGALPVKAAGNGAVLGAVPIKPAMTGAVSSGALPVKPAMSGPMSGALPVKPAMAGTLPLNQARAGAVPGAVRDKQAMAGVVSGALPMKPAFSGAMSLVSPIKPAVSLGALSRALLVKPVVSEELPANRAMTVPLPASLPTKPAGAGERALLVKQATEGGVSGALLVKPALPGAVSEAVPVKAVSGALSFKQAMAEAKLRALQGKQGGAASRALPAKPARTMLGASTIKPAGVVSGALPIKPASAGPVKPIGAVSGVLPIKPARAEALSVNPARAMSGELPRKPSGALLEALPAKPAGALSGALHVKPAGGVSGALPDHPSRAGQVKPSGGVLGALPVDLARPLSKALPAKPAGAGLVKPGGAVSIALHAKLAEAGALPAKPAKAVSGALQVKPAVSGAGAMPVKLAEARALPNKPAGAVLGAFPLKPVGAVQETSLVKPGAAVPGASPVKPAGVGVGALPAKPAGAVQGTTPVKPPGAEAVPRALPVVKPAGTLPVKPTMLGAVSGALPVKPAGTGAGSMLVKPAGKGAEALQAKPARADAVPIKPAMGGAALGAPVNPSMARVGGVAVKPLVEGVVPVMPLVSAVDPRALLGKQASASDKHRAVLEKQAAM